jgi:LAO/AO transport system kinase
VVNKCDLPRADLLARQLAEFVNLEKEDGWRVPIVQTIAIRDDGVASLVEAVEAHRRHLVSSGLMERLQREQARRRLLSAVHRQLWEIVWREVGDWDELVEAVARRQVDPFTAAQGLVERALGRPQL